MTMKNTNSIIGFEENGGFFYGLLNYVRDGAITTALILEMLSYYKQKPSKINKLLVIRLLDYEIVPYHAYLIYIR